jgi:hypothetical protein
LLQLHLRQDAHQSSRVRENSAKDVDGKKCFSVFQPDGSIAVAESQPFQFLQKITILPPVLACNVEERPMAKRTKHARVRKTKAKVSKKRTQAGKKSVRRAVGKKSRKTAKTSAAKKMRKRVTSLKRVRPHTQEAPSAVETMVIDVVDEPIPGVVRVTEIEETRVTLPDPDAPTSRDIPEPDSLGG